MTANQLVAYNLRRARELRGLTQEQAAEQLEPYLGRRWSKATFSAAETSTTSGRTREFSADEILAFSAVFGVPVTWFFLPPRETDPLREEVTTGGSESMDGQRLLDVVAPMGPDTALVERFIELGSGLPLSGRDPAAARLRAEFQAEVDEVIENALAKFKFAQLAEIAKEVENDG